MNPIFGEKANTLIDMTLGDLLDRTAEVFPDTDAVFYNDRPFAKTYAEFRDTCNEVARGLLAIGVKKGGHVAIWATNYPEWIVLMFATAKIGATLVTVNTNYKIYEAEYLLRQSDTDTLVMMRGLKDTCYTDIINELCPTLRESQPGCLEAEALPCLKRVIYIDRVEDTPAGMFHWSELFSLASKVTEEERARVQATVDPYDVVNMQYTSGTTGFPKGVMLTHRGILNNGKCIGDNQKLTEKDRVCLPVPFFHCFGCVLGIMACVTHGSTMVPVERYHPVRTMNAIRDGRCTATYGVPTMYIAMLEHPDFSKYDFSNMRTGIMSGSPCPVKVMELVVNRMHMTEITIPYGMTETSPVCTMTNTEDPIIKRVETVGRPMPFLEVKVVDPETNADLPPNTPGEVVVRGYSVMKGYYKMPEATANAIDADGWYHSGDLAEIDDDGFFKITGRIKDMIIRGGENIYPKELEEFLYAHPKVRDVQVIGVPDETYGEEVCACIILRDDIRETENEDDLREEIMEYTLARIARHKKPRYIWFMDSFPMTASGKIQKFKMREMAVRHFLKGKDE
ncbi:MAG: AMP-binding protein [Clostridia bacterium]|nr:AMP-binding protein [Clostridia bacterium]